MKFKPDVLLSDDSGKIELIPLFHQYLKLDYAGLFDALQLKQESIYLFGKEVLQPRLSAFYSDKGVHYKYSQKVFHGLAWTAELKELKTEIENVLYTLQGSQQIFNSALVNYYRNGSDSMGLHTDDEPELGHNPIIASMNYGEKRKMVFRRNGTKNKLQFELGHGDLLIMSGALQHNWKHEVPKQAKIAKPRLNITFRKIMG